MEHVTLDLGVMNWSSTLGMDLVKKKKKEKKKSKKEKETNRQDGNFTLEQ